MDKETLQTAIFKFQFFAFCIGCGRTEEAQKAFKEGMKILQETYNEMAG